MSDAAPIDTSSLFRLDGQVALVTGASSGLGRRFARVLAGAGCSLAVTARRGDSLAELAESLPNTVAIVEDLGDSAGPQRVIDRVVEHYGRIDLLVSNAGMSQAGTADTEPLEGVEQILRVNLLAPLDLARRCAVSMRHTGGGRIIFVASMLGLVGCGQTQPSYVASKGATLAMTRELAAQWADDGIRVNALAPGWFRSELTDEMFTDEGATKWMSRSALLKRPGNADELDGPLLYLASEASSFATGSTLVVDGGWTAV
jgi:NAD(P)-dependent dehydrogenase (short-subunit alcohol dehydrogenase family)